jgi:chemotaxis protein histidine kinase CheA
VAFDEATRELAGKAEQLDRKHQELMSTNRRLAEERGLLAAVLENVAAGVVSVDREGKIFTCNGAALRMLRQRDHEIPLISLSALFQLDSAQAATSAIVVRRGSERFAFAVDRLLTQQEVVIRPLEDPLVKVHGVSGTTDLGDGAPTLVLDLISLANRAGAFHQGAAP